MDMPMDSDLDQARRELESGAWLHEKIDPDTPVGKAVVTGYAFLIALDDMARVTHGDVEALKREYLAQAMRELHAEGRL